MLPRRSWFPPVSDAAIALLLAVVVVGITTAASRWQHFPAMRPLDPVGYLWLVAGAVPLAWRRRAPTTVLALTAALVFSYYLSNYPGGPSVVLPTVALITVTAVRGAAWGAASAAVLAAVVLVTPLLAGFPLELLGGVGAGMLLWLIASVAVGTAIRARRDTIQAVRNEAEEAGRRRFEEERLRIAREIHDVVAHSLAMISVQASVGAHVGDRRPEQATAALLEIKRASRSALADLRATLSVLRGDDDESSFSPSLERLPELIANAEASGLRVEVTGEAAGLPTHVDAAAYRILQESMTNTIRHASGATAIDVRFERSENALVLHATDDGRPSTVDSTGTGHGLDGMRERANALGGWVVAGPGESGGFEVTAHLPLNGRRE